MEEALGSKGGDALINVTVTSSLYGFIPIYNVYSFTCTTVKGIAVKFQSVQPKGPESLDPVLP